MSNVLKTLKEKFDEINALLIGLINQQMVSSPRAEIFTQKIIQAITALDMIKTNNATAKKEIADIRQRLIAMDSKTEALSLFRGKQYAQQLVKIQNDYTYATSLFKHVNQLLTST